MNHREKTGLSGIVVFCSLLFATMVKSDHTVENGGGFAEQHTLYALLNIHHVIGACRATDRTCFLSEREERALEALLTTLNDIQSDQGYIEFKTEAEEERFLPGAGTWYLTEQEPGAPVIVNRDMIYRPTGTGLTLPFQLGEAFMLVAKILLYQSTDLDLEERHRLATSLGVFSRSRGIRRVCCSSHIYRPDLRIELKYFQRPGPSENLAYTEVIIKDSESWRVIDGSISSALDCGGSDVIGFGVGVPFIREENREIASLGVLFRAEVRYHCSGSEDTIRGGHVLIGAVFDEVVVPDPLNDRDVAFRLRVDSVDVRMAP